VLFEALWAHHISRHGVTKVTPFELVYGQEDVLSIEVNLDPYRLAKLNNHDIETYYALMMGNIDKVADKRLEALGKIERSKRRVVIAYR
jgi:hypothetical protein